MLKKRLPERVYSNLNIKFENIQNKCSVVVFNGNIDLRSVSFLGLI